MSTRSLVQYLMLYHALLVDLPSIVYASIVTGMRFSIVATPLQFWPFWIAKYNGFAINLATTWLLLCVMRNVKKAAITWMPWLRYRSIVEYRLEWPRLALNRSHALYTYRVLIAAFLHTLAHVFFTHPFRLDYDTTFRRPITVDNLLLNNQPEFGELPLVEQARIAVISFLTDSFTWTGYTLLLVLFIPILLTGYRLICYSRQHYRILIVHRVFAAITIPLLVWHHPIYVWPTLWTAMVVVDFLLGWLAYTQTCRIARVHRFPNYQLEDQHQLNDVIDVLFVYPFERLENFQPGDYVRVKVPSVSRYEWHDFTLMRSDSTTALNCNVHLTIRSVGRWTGRLYRLAENEKTELSVKGPYSLNLYDPLMHRIMLSGSSRFELLSGNVPVRPNNDGWLSLHHIRMPRTLVLACSGTAITHFMSILDVLIPLYYNGYRYDELPQRIVVCWTVRTVFNLNFALIPLSRYQRMLSDCMLSDLLVYEFFVSQRPENSDALCAQAFRRMLLATQKEFLPTAATIREKFNDRLNRESLFVRNSRLSMLDITNGDQNNTALGSRINYENFGEKHLRGGADTLLIVNTSVKAMQLEFEALAKKHGCTIHADNLF
jgi:hypothetical protein